MKAARLILAIAGGVLILGLAYAPAAACRLQPSSGNSTRPVSSRSSDDEQAASASHPPGESSQVLNHAHPRRPVKLQMPGRPKQVRSSRGLSRSEDAWRRESPALNKSPGVSGSIAHAHARAIQPSTDSAIAGRQSRHGRNLARVPPALGGSTNARRSTQGINGSEIRPRH
jgi:hypothetical protein